VLDGLKAYLILSPTRYPTPISPPAPLTTITILNRPPLIVHLMSMVLAGESSGRQERARGSGGVTSGGNVSESSEEVGTGTGRVKDTRSSVGALTTFELEDTYMEVIFAPF
jgi:hypothetical protein